MITTDAAYDFNQLCSTSINYALLQSIMPILIIGVKPDSNY